MFCNNQILLLPKKKQRDVTIKNKRFDSNIKYTDNQHLYLRYKTSKLFINKLILHNIFKKIKSYLLCIEEISIVFQDHIESRLVPSPSINTTHIV